jgi:hypothetical protein
MIIRHKRFLDVCFEVFTGLEDRAVGKWINMGYVNSFYLPVKSEIIEIKNKAEWEKCTTPNVKCLRYGTWVPL